MWIKQIILNTDALHCTFISKLFDMTFNKKYSFDIFTTSTYYHIYATNPVLEIKNQNWFTLFVQKKHYQSIISSTTVLSCANSRKYTPKYTPKTNIVFFFVFPTEGIIMNVNRAVTQRQSDLRKTSRAYFITFFYVPTALNFLPLFTSLIALWGL